MLLLYRVVLIVLLFDCWITILNYFVRDVLIWNNRFYYLPGNCSRFWHLQDISIHQRVTDSVRVYESLFITNSENNNNWNMFDNARWRWIMKLQIHIFILHKTFFFFCFFKLNTYGYLKTDHMWVYYMTDSNLFKSVGHDLKPWIF